MDKLCTVQNNLINFATPESVLEKILSCYRIPIPLYLTAISFEILYRKTRSTIISASPKQNYQANTNITIVHNSHGTDKFLSSPSSSASSKISFKVSCGSLQFQCHIHAPKVHTVAKCLYCI